MTERDLVEATLANSDINNDTTYSISSSYNNKGSLTSGLCRSVILSHKLYFDVLDICVALFRILAKSRPEPLHNGKITMIQCAQCIANMLTANLLLLIMLIGKLLGEI